VRRFSFTFSLILVLLATSCSSATQQEVSLTVLAAASLTEPFEEIATLFEADNPGVTVQFSFAGSQQLAKQLAEGASADVFACANLTYMDQAVADGRVNIHSPINFTQNRLVIITPSSNPGEIQAISDLSRPGLKLVLAAEAVPVGKYTLEFLEKASHNSQYPTSFKEDVLANVVSYENNVKSVLAKVLLGEADAGVVYTSDISGDASDQVIRIDIPEPLNVIAKYPIATIENSPNEKLAQAFVDFVLSPEGQEVLTKYGFFKTQ